MPFCSSPQVKSNPAALVFSNCMFNVIFILCYACSGLLVNRVKKDFYPGLDWLWGPGVFFAFPIAKEVYIRTYTACPWLFSNHHNWLGNIVQVVKAGVLMDSGLPSGRVTNLGIGHTPRGWWQQVVVSAAFSPNMSPLLSWTSRQGKALHQKPEEPVKLWPASSQCGVSVSSHSRHKRVTVKRTSINKRKLRVSWLGYLIKSHAV